MELLEFVPAESKAILDVGCGSGAFGSLCKKKNNAHITGLEFNESCKTSAEAVLDNVVIGDANETILGFDDACFDLIICNDFLEHIVDPVGFLGNASRKLRPDGSLLCSIPNFRYLENLINLLVKKDFHYQDSGILDNTHLRFFTEKSIKRLFRELGMKVILFRGINTIRGFRISLLKPVLRLLNSGDVVHPQFVILARKQAGKPGKSFELPVICH